MFRSKRSGVSSDLILCRSSFYLVIYLLNAPDFSKKSGVYLDKMYELKSITLVDMCLWLG
jgi:hypothetical protein